LRLRGDYLAIVTLGFGEIVRISAQNTDAIGGPRGIAGIPHPPNMSEFEVFGVKPFTYGVLDPRPYYYLLVFLIVLTIIFVKRLENSRVGRAWAAIREDEDAAELMGVPTFRFKLAAFAIGAAIGGAVGVVWAAKVISIIPANFPFILSATILAAVVLGGSGNIPGVMLGAFLIAWLPERFRVFQDYRILLFGAALVLMMALRPEGLWPSRRRKAELEEGTGGMGTMGAEVAGPGTSVEAEATATEPSR
jgi:branched-chain amino acid transport system permease protein